MSSVTKISDRIAAAFVELAYAANEFEQLRPTLRTEDGRLALRIRDALTILEDISIEITSLRAPKPTHKSDLAPAARA